MFKVGKKYSLVLLEDDAGETAETMYAQVTITDVDGPLIKINFGSQEVIINTHSPRFLRATKSR